MTNAINNSLYKIMRETKQNIHGQTAQSQPCPRCYANMYLTPIGDGRMGQFQCQRCKYKVVVRLA